MFTYLLTIYIVCIFAKNISHVAK